MVDFTKKMSLMDSAKYQQRTGRKPKNIIIAIEKPIEPNEVIQLYGFNLIVEKELTRKEFDELHKYNLTKPDPAQGSSVTIGSRVDIENAKKDVENPPESCKYYYKMKFQYSQNLRD